MRNLNPGEDVFHRPTDIPGKVVRAVGGVVTIELFDPAGTGKRIQKVYPADELETHAERADRVHQEVDESRDYPGKPKPPKKPPYDV